MEIIEATPADSVLVADFITRLLAELSGAENSDPSDLLEISASLLARDDVIGLFAYDGDAPIGLIMLNQCAAIYAGGLFGEVTELFVQSDRRSVGVAQTLLHAAKELGRARGWTRLEVGAPTQPKWQRSLRFYQREGFQETGPRLRLLL
ncbi:GNAT family N-acetyltransferase [Pseudophaeobacter flagellatus]|uniref:GNAT family N-acetyltransferase n=1 Tax=Pseudophaeobacter flagellatus TaxID=2899119 RepID=UPI001E4669EA|nr:GNAT family N-acetyltransferase [Pseudophaeobacter flagellatus]MCD9146694.1 GNAT family N-acetyltransferase [Pseudophaeobacter flagellatus]